MCIRNLFRRIIGEVNETLVRTLFFYGQYFIKYEQTFYVSTGQSYHRSYILWVFICRMGVEEVPVETFPQLYYSRISSDSWQMFTFQVVLLPTKKQTEHEIMKINIFIIYSIIIKSC